MEQHLTNLINTYYLANKRAYESANNPLRSHGADHHYRVCMNALKLAEGKDVDLEVLVVAALLHYMAAYYPEETGEQYHDFDHLHAEKILKENSFPEVKIPLVLDAIKNHGSDSKYKKEDEPLEISILRDADKMEVFGPLGIARIVMVRTLKGDTLEEIVDDFYKQGHLEKKWNSITSEEVKSLLRSDYEYAMDFLKRLDESLKASRPS
jgi:HD superfamily phosphodiesterase